MTVHMPAQVAGNLSASILKLGHRLHLAGGNGIGNVNDLANGLQQTEFKFLIIATLAAAGFLLFGSSKKSRVVSLVAMAIMLIVFATQWNALVSFIHNTLHSWHVV